MTETTLPTRPVRRPHRQADLDYHEIGQGITEKTLDGLPQEYASARREDRKKLLTGAVQKIVALGVTADHESVLACREELMKLGAKLPALVLRGRLEQQFACKLATQLALPRPRIKLPKCVIGCVVEPLTRALIDVLTLGAPTTRDAAVEGLGGLLKLFDKPAERFKLLPRLPVAREDDETDEEFAKRVTISNDYFDRLERRHLMVLTIAEDPDSQTEFCRRLAEPINEKIKRLRARDPVPWDEIEDALYAYPDLLRILPAIKRQKSKIAIDSAALLSDAAQLLTVDSEASDSVTVALARFQESVFRTVDAAMRRFDWNWRELDKVIAAAVRGIPRSIVGTPAMCNAQIRATVAIVRTAIVLIVITSEAPLTKIALNELFRELGTRKPWSNLGIVEGCYRGLPALLAQHRHDRLTAGPLASLVEQLSRPHRFDELSEVHRHVIANACFRRIVATVMDVGDDRDPEVELCVRALLRYPTAENIRRVCRQQPPVDKVTNDMPVEIAQAVIANIAFESELLARSAAMFDGWISEPTARKVLLTRILAAELHTIARDIPELDRHPLLGRIFAGIETVSLTDANAKTVMFKLLSSLPADAAETADAEVQRFVEYRGDESVNDLPGYVLAMISTTASGRIAGAIAREIDLHLRYERRNAAPGDFAKWLYQVTLRGPHESIFDHLLPRIRGDADRQKVLLFRRHVARVLASRKDEQDAELDVAKILQHVRRMHEDLNRRVKVGFHTTLSFLHEALGHFINLTEDAEGVWRSLATDKALELFTGLDDLARDEAHRDRKPLSVYSRRLTDLKDDVIHYLSLPIGSFEERKETLTKASDIVAELESALRSHGLEPPERTLLIAVMRHLRSLFDDTRQWACDEARKLKERSDKPRFWYFFCDPRSKGERIDALSEAVKTGAGLNLHSQADIRRITDQIEQAPPPFKSQREKFEEYFVEWMTSELDVESLKRFLKGRWPWFFQGLYGITTNFWLTSLTILTPLAIAAWLDSRGRHEWEGIGFFIVTSGMIVAGLFSFTQWIHTLATLLRGERKVLPGYWFPCLLPRLARLTAVPMALIVEFDHSYDFPLHGSSWALLLLAGVSFLTTRFFVTREMVDREEQPGVNEITPEERRHVRQIVAVALAHSFGIAVILSAIFSASHKPKQEAIDDFPTVRTVAGTPASYWKVLEEMLARVDKITPAHAEPKFLGIIPRKVTLDFGVIAENAHYPLPPNVAEHAAFRFYPTVILVWTALGLFFGVFLEGFMKGARLRGLPAQGHAGDGGSP